MKHLVCLIFFVAARLFAAEWSSVSRGTLPPADSMPIYPASPGLTNAPVASSSGAPATRNWYAPILLAPVSHAPDGGSCIVDAVVVPEGIYSTMRNAGEVIAAYPEALAAMVARYRAGLSPNEPPVYIEHDRTRPAGRVMAIYYDAGRGLRVRMALTAPPAPGLRPSAELRLLSSPAADSAGTWGCIRIPWALVGVGLTQDPALDTSIVEVMR